MQLYSVVIHNLRSHGRLSLHQNSLDPKSTGDHSIPIDNEVNETYFVCTVVACMENYFAYNDLVEVFLVDGCVF